MTVSKQTYSAAAPWSAAQLAALFEQAFIDAGLMTGWHDAFAVSGIENRILRLEYDASKTYGRCCYWFMFTSSNVFLNVCLDWDAASHVPTGERYFDYYATTTNSTSNHRPLGYENRANNVITLSSGTAIALKRYTSGLDGSFSWFVLQGGNKAINFHLPVAGAPIAPWIDLDKVIFHHFVFNVCYTSGNQGIISFNTGLALRRSYIATTALYGNAESSAGRFDGELSHFRAWGKQNNSVSGNASYGYPWGPLDLSLVIPVGAPGNPAYSAVVSPILTDLVYTNYLTTRLPADFGVAVHFDDNSMTPGDTFVSGGGSEEWEILNVRNQDAIPDKASPLFLARTL